MQKINKNNFRINLKLYSSLTSPCKSQSFDKSISDFVSSYKDSPTLF